MKNPQKKSIILLLSAMLIISLFQIINQYVEMPDFMIGVILGTSVGLSLIALLRLRKVEIIK